LSFDHSRATRAALAQAGQVSRLLPWPALFSITVLNLHRRVTDCWLVWHAYNGAPRATRNRMADALRVSRRAVERATALVIAETGLDKT